MIFEHSEVQKVFEKYEKRAEMDRQRMLELGRAGFAKRDEFLLPVGLDVGRFLHALILAKKPRRILELGTSYGYSTLFLADAARHVGAQVITMELADYKQAFALEMLSEARLQENVDFRCGDAVVMIAEDKSEFDLVLLDIWKELYLPCFYAFYPKLSEEAIIAADNMIEPELARPEVRKFREAVRSKSDLQTSLLPIGNGIELSVKWNADNPKL